MEGDEYSLTEAEVLDTLQFVVAAERRAAASEATAPAHEEEGREDDEKLHGAKDGTRPPPASSGGSQPTASNTTSTTAAATPYQNRQKQELDYLKAKVRELEAELRRMERENDERLAQVDDSMWQRIAQQQYVEKQKSLSENSRLREELEGQIKFAKSLERVIRKRPNLTAFGENEDGKSTGGHRRKMRRRQNRASAANLRDELAEAIEREFLRTDDVLDASGLGQILRDHRSVDVKVIDDDTASSSSSTNSTGAVCDLRVDWMIARRYPFPFHAVARELWKILAFSTVGHVADMDRNVEHTDDTLVATTTLKVPVGQRECSLTATAIIRQFVEEDSVTIMWVSDGECEPSKAAKDTFKLYEIGWIKMKPFPGDPSSCISHTLGYYYPTFSERSRGSPSSSSSDNEGMGSPTDTSQESEDMGLLTELVSTVYEKSATQIHAAIENALMTEAITQGKSAISV